MSSMWREGEDMDTPEFAEFEYLSCQMASITVAEEDSMSVFSRTSTLTFKMLNIYVSKFVIHISSI